jgi:DnaJ-domain-containing protein 1
MRSFTDYFQKKSPFLIKKFEWKSLDIIQIKENGTEDEIRNWNQKQLDTFFDKLKPVNRFVILESSTTQYGETTDQRLLKFQMVYNDVRNTYGEYIRFVFSTQEYKEGIDLYSTQMVHFLEPVSSTSIFYQAIRRASRYCSMRYLPNVYQDWIVTVIIYYALESEKEVEMTKKISQGELNPVEKALQVLKESAIDCEYFTKLNKISCGKGFPKKKVKAQLDDNGMDSEILEYCVDPSGRFPDIPLRYENEKNIQGITIKNCHRKNRIPNGLISYDLWDEILYRALKNYGYEPIPFPNTFWIRLKNFFLMGWFNKNQISFSRICPVQTLYQKLIRERNRDYGNAVLYLLHKKREKTDPKDLELFDKSAGLLLERLLIDQNVVDTTNKFKKLLHSCIQSIERYSPMYLYNQYTQLQDIYLKVLRQLNKRVDADSIKSVPIKFPKPIQITEPSPLVQHAIPLDYTILNDIDNSSLDLIPLLHDEKPPSQGPPPKPLLQGPSPKLMLQGPPPKPLLQGPSVKSKLHDIQHKKQIVSSKSIKALETLGLSQDATASDIKKAYRKLALRYHPDKFVGDNKKQGQQRFKEINNAFQFLTKS